MTQVSMHPGLVGSAHGHQLRVGLGLFDVQQCQADGRFETAAARAGRVELKHAITLRSTSSCAEIDRPLVF